MTKRPVENIRRRTFLKENEAKVAALRASAVQHHQPQIDLDFIDQVFAPYSKRLAEANFDNENPDQLVDAVVNLVAGQVVELCNNLIPLQSPNLAFEFGTEFMGQLAEHVGESLRAIYAKKH